LNEYLKAKNIPLWPSFPSSGGLAGPMGNILERGAGYNRTGEHAANFCGMEVVLADGQVVRTGMGGVEKTTAWQAYRWGYGPWVDGLFLQSNFGIVTKIGVWLMKRPAAHKFFVVGYPDLESMGRGIDVMRDLRLENVLETGIVGSQLYSLAATLKRSEIYKGPGSIPPDVLEKFYASKGLPPFATLSTLYGTPKQIEVNFEIVKAAFAKTGGTVVSGKALDKLEDAKHWERNMTGDPNVPEFAIYNFRGGGGSMWFAPVVPARGKEVVKVFSLIDSIFRKHGFDAAGGMLVYGRHLDMVVDLLFDRTKEDEVKRAYACYDECLEKCAKEGYGVYRTNTSFMDKAAVTYGQAQRALNKRLKKALDPNGVIAPGKSGVDV
jgi:4-cresol dehydrogenase (hydroxylating)